MTKRTEDRDLNIYFKDIRIDRVSNHKFLGVIIDNKLKFDKQINDVANKLSRTIGVIKRISFAIPDNIKNNLFFSLFYSNLIYSITVWGSACPTLLNRITTLTNNAIGLMSHQQSHSIQNLCLNNRILSFHNSYRYFICIKMFEILKCNKHVYFLNFINNEQVDHAHHTRFLSNSNLVLPLYNRSKTQRSFVYRGITFWNALPAYIRNINNILLFKKTIKDYFITLD